MIGCLGSKSLWAVLARRGRLREEEVPVAGVKEQVIEMIRKLPEDSSVDDIIMAEDSETYAVLFARRVLALVETLPDVPRSGRVVPE